MLLISKLISALDEGEEISFALRNEANHYGINIEQVREVIRDINEKEAKYINSESSKDDYYNEEEWLKYPKAHT